MPNIPDFFYAKYYYEHDNGILSERCKFNKFKNPMIGSSVCSDCTFNIRYDDTEHWIRCKKMPEGKRLNSISNIGTIDLYEK